MFCSYRSDHLWKLALRKLSNLNGFKDNSLSVPFWITVLGRTLNDLCVRETASVADLGGSSKYSNENFI